MGIICEIIFKLWSYLPVFAVTNPENFMEVRLDSQSGRCSVALSSYIKQILYKSRFSFINIWIGTHVLQVGSVSRLQKFELIKAYHLSQNGKIQETLKDYNKHEKKYRCHMIFLSEKNLNYEYEALKLQIEEYKKAIDFIFVKQNCYIVILVLWMSWYVSNFKDIIKPIFGLDYFNILILYFFIDILFLIVEFNKVRARQIYRFSDIKEARNKAREVNVQLYYNWQHLKKSQQLFASLLSLLEGKLVLMVLLSLVYVVSFCIVQGG